MSELLEQIEALISPHLAKEQVELVDLTFQTGPNGWVLSIYLDKPNGITLDECQHWSEIVGCILDQKDLISHSYSLEICSPGLNRPLKKLRDFEKFKGERVQLKLFSPIDGQKTYRGTLLGADDNIIQLQTEDNPRQIVLPRMQVAKAFLDPIIDI